MRNYVILTDTGSDLEKSLRDEFNLEYVPMRFSLNGKDYDADLDWQSFSPTEFYNLMREGNRFISAQTNAVTYRATFEKYLAKDLDVLYVATSSQISASVTTAKLVAEEIMKERPEAKIICVDALRACYALGMLAIRASELRAEGKTIEETAAWLEENKLTVNMAGSVESLKYLRQAGRVSATSAFFAGVLNIKPIIIADALGRNFALEKVKGRKTSMVRTVELIKEAYEDVPYQRIFISHADCIEDAEELKTMIEEAIGKNVYIHIGYVGTGVGSAVGPGMFGVFCYGKKVTVNQEL